MAAIIKAVGREQIDPEEVSKMLDVENQTHKYIYTMEEAGPLILNVFSYKDLTFPPPDRETRSFIDGFFSKNYQSSLLNLHLLKSMKGTYEDRFLEQDL